MTVYEAVEKMQATVLAAKDRLEGNGFIMSVETEYMNSMLKTVTDVNKAKYVTVALIVGAKDGKEGDEYCMSLGAQINRKSVNDAELDTNVESYGKMVDEAIDTLEKYENKDEGLAHLTEKANEEYQKLLAKIKEEQDKSRRISRIINIVFIAGIALLFILTLFKK